jgi:hypothetical protein
MVFCRADDGVCLGLAHRHLWPRQGKASPNDRQWPMEEKESIRWIDTARAGQKCLAAAARITRVADRGCVHTLAQQGEGAERWLRSLRKILVISFRAENK